MKKNKFKTFDQLENAEKEAIYQECEAIGLEDGLPLDAADERRHRRAGLSVGRPRIGKGAKRINISMEKGLLNTADRFARKHGMTRAGLIAQSVHAFLSGAA